MFRRYCLDVIRINKLSCFENDFPLKHSEFIMISAVNPQFNENKSHAKYDSIALTVWVFVYIVG